MNPWTPASKVRVVALLAAANPNSAANAMTVRRRYVMRPPRRFRFDLVHLATGMPHRVRTIAPRIARFGNEVFLAGETCRPIADRSRMRKSDISDVCTGRVGERRTRRPGGDSRGGPSFPSSVLRRLADY